MTKTSRHIAASPPARLAPALALAWILALTCAFSLPARAQAPNTAHGSNELAGDPSVPDVPAGTGALRGRLIHPGGGAATQGSTIVLYALSADGRPGVRSAEADAEGLFNFENISNAPSVVYLVGARYGSVPYGKRVQFEAGESELWLQIEVAEPSSDVSQVRVGESSMRVEWIGTSLAIEEIHHLSNAGGAVVVVPPSMRETSEPAFRAELPAGANSLDTNLAGLADGFERRGSQLLFWGPVYPKEQELRFRYLVPAAEGEPLVWTLASGSQRATLLFPDRGLTLSGDGLEPGPDVTLENRSYRSLDGGRLNPGDSLTLAVERPATSRDTAAIHFPRADLWMEVDDTFLQVTVELDMTVTEGAYLAGTLGDPLLRFEFPPDAELRGLSPEAQNLGLLPGQSGGLNMIGPLAPGEATLSYRYRVTVRDEVAAIDLHFPMSVDLLNVLVADTGVIIETDRLHRRRPFRSGTRVFLHREAYQIDSDERISLRLTPIERSDTSRRSALIAVTGMAALSVWFIFAPLTARASAREDLSGDGLQRDERQLIYESLRDLEHDFETGKVEPADYETVRGALRTQAMTLLKQEQQAARQGDRAAAAAAATSGEAAPAARFCPSCGEQVTTAWRFCAGCGAALPGPAPGGAPDANPGPEA